MASPAVPPSTSGGVNSSMWANQPPPARAGWGRGGEPGAAFRGLSKGRPGGRGGGRGGRGGRAASGRGGAPSRLDDNPAKSGPEQGKDKPSKSTVGTPKVTPAVVPPVIPTSAQGDANATNKASSRPKTSRRPSEQKGSRKASSASSEPPTVTAANASPSNSTNSRPAPRRKRSRTHNNKVPPAASVLPGRKPSLSVDPNVGRLRSEKPPSSASKDLPPHLAPSSDAHSFDIKHDIEALVERVRAVAMDRPNTPGSHIDWAGDDDDSLPDLDDWGVTSSAPEPATSTSETGKPDVISPILEGALRPLPTLADVDIDTPHSTSGELDADDIAPTNFRQELPIEVDEREGVVTPHVEDAAKEAMVGPIHTEPVKSTKTDSTISEVSPPKAITSLPLHPSLPPKPFTCFDTSTIRAPRGRVAEPSKTIAPLQPVIVEPVAENSLAQSTHAPSSASSARSITSNDSSPERGLSASMYANIPISHSAPSHLSAHAFPHAFPHAPRNGFNPSHNRAHTLGRPSSFRPPHSASSTDLSSPLSDTDRPRRGDNAYHARTHSSPPTGPGTATAHARTSHASRPVITVDAISKLARTLGGTPLAKRETPMITVAAKD